MHDGESIQSALCPWMSRYCVLYDETRPHNIMNGDQICCWMQLPKLIIAHVNMKYAWNDSHYELVVSVE